MRAKKNRPVNRSRAETLAADTRLTEASAMLALAAPAFEPPARVKEQLLARIRGLPASTAVAWEFGALNGPGGWVPLPFPGVRMREVTVDTARDTALLYVEMAAGAVFPDHEHAAAERGIVLSGDLEMSGRRLSAGEFYEAAAGTRHERISSRSGCTGLLWVGAAAWANWQAAIAKQQ
jgi:quercetin dioxygenase-like cupin family protein